MPKTVNKKNVIIEKGILYPPGITVFEDRINCVLEAEKDAEYQLVLYKKHEKAAELTFHLSEEPLSQYKFGNLYVFSIRGIAAEGLEYLLKKNENPCLDPYVKVLTGRDKYNQPYDFNDLRCGFYHSDDYDWEGDKPLCLPYHQCIMYSLHVRGFTRHISSKVKHKGTFWGIREKIPYLKRLGINQVKLMPCYEFDEQIREGGLLPINPAIKEFMNPDVLAGMPHINYWGYGEGYYFAPKASYAATGDPVRELKDLLKELHKNKMEIILEFCFTRQAGSYYIDQCIRYWVTEYHIDGVHILGENISSCMLASDPLLSKTKIIYGALDEEKMGYRNKESDFKNLGEYKDSFLITMRRFLKSDQDQLYDFLYHINNNPPYYGTVNYITEHNGFTLSDLVSYDKKHNEGNGEDNNDGSDYNYSWNCGVEGKTRKRQVLHLRKKQIKNAFCFLLLSQGTPMILSGDEMAKTQLGNNNAYCQDNEISYVDWSLLKSQDELFRFTQKMIAFRKEHPILHNPFALHKMDYLGYGYPDISYHSEKAWCPKIENFNRHIGIMYCGKYAKKDKTFDDFIYIAYNMHWEEHEFALPRLPDGLHWYLETNTNEKEGFCEDDKERVPLQDQRKVMAAGRSIVILIGK